MLLLLVAGVRVVVAEVGVCFIVDVVEETASDALVDMPT